MKRISLPEILKWLLVILLCVFLVRKNTGETMSTANFSNVAEKVFAAADQSKMKQGDNLMIRRLYQLDPSTFDAITLFYPATNMGAEEILLVHLKDAKQADQVVKRMEARVESQKTSFQGYGAEQVAMLDQAVIEAKGGYALLAVTASPEKVKKAFEAAL